MEVFSERQGTEFDWFALDETGEIAVLSTGGCGPVPIQVRSAADLHDMLGERIDVTGWGTSAVWASYSRVRMFAYDWNDSLRCYTRVAKPGQDASSMAFAKLVEESLPRLALSFRSSPMIGADELVV